MESIERDGAGQAGELLVFVYGTSLRGESHHELLHGARYVGPGRTRAAYDLVDLGGFPAMLEGGRTPVDGEVYAIDPTGVRLLDEAEDHPEYFRRTRIALEDGRTVFTYVLPERQGRPYPCIPSGSWRARAGGVPTV